MFNLQSEYQPTGDQPQAIKELTAGIKRNLPLQTLLGVTGSGKTFTMANVIANTQKPTLIIAHNKTLAAQLWAEMKEYFPENEVHYFVSYYDYYQPEAYIPATDTYIEKDLEINDEIDKLRHGATHALLTKKDVIIVATVSCIYGLGSPQIYASNQLSLRKGQTVKQSALLSKLSSMHYERNDVELKRGRFRVSGENIDVYLAYDDVVLRINLNFDSIDQMRLIHPVTYQPIKEVDEETIFPAKHYLTKEENFEKILAKMERDLAREVQVFSDAGQIVEAQRLKQRTKYDLEMIRETGHVKGIENYSRYFDERPAGSAPSVLLDYFPKNHLLIIDESHMTIPQIGGMFNGDQARKDNLIAHGFRLQAARDNRPLKFSEFAERMGQTIAVSATPGDFELTNADQIVEQLIRPTGLIDPEIEIRPVDKQVPDLIAEIKKRTDSGQRTLVTTLTKRMSEDLTEYLTEQKIKVQYLHSEIITTERSEILKQLREGKFDVLVGINLLREGLDLPEVSLVAILDADKEGFLRSATSLIQTIGRAARHLDGKVILYANTETKSIKQAVRETNRRRKIQQEYNQTHGITPASIIKAIKESGLTSSGRLLKNDQKKLTRQQRASLIENLKEEMRTAAENLDFERAAIIRDEIEKLKR